MNQMRSKILIADDDVAILDAVSMMLVDEGFDVTSTTDGNTLSILQKEKIDLVLLDIWMSGIDGRDICREIRATPKVKDIPIIMISASREAEAMALAAGADVFIPKPFDIDDFLGRIRALLKEKSI